MFYFVRKKEVFLDPLRLGLKINMTKTDLTREKRTNFIEFLHYMGHKDKKK